MLDTPWKRPGRRRYAAARLTAFRHPPVKVHALPDDVLVETDVPVRMPDGVTLRLNLFRPRAASVLTGSDAGLTAQEAAMAAWARRITTDPNATTPADVDRLREVGLDDDQVFAITVFVGLRIAMATVDGALGARPDADLVAALPAEVRAVVGYGRQPLSA